MEDKGFRYKKQGEKKQMRVPVMCVYSSCLCSPVNNYLWNSIALSSNLYPRKSIAMKQTACILILAAITLSCNYGYKTKYPYTVKDYSNNLQPYLLKALTLGLPGYDSAVHFLNEQSSVEELKKLALCEHPVLRMLALRVLMWRKEIDHYPIIMSHLDDSAMVATDEGEFGMGMKTVTDFMLQHAHWASKEKRNEAADFILMHHNNFSSAYIILRRLPLNEKYYAIVKEMVQRENHSYDYEIENALWYLAQFNRKEDISLIKSIMDANDWWLGQDSFKIMEEYPDDRYLDILQYYGKSTLWRDMRSDDFRNDRMQYFYEAVGVYKNKRAADLLSWLLKYIPADVRCNYYAEDYCVYLYKAICDNSCESYKDLVPLVEPYVMRQRSWNSDLGEIGVDKVKMSAEEEKEPVHWFQ
jgi:hypothetical protein